MTQSTSQYKRSAPGNRQAKPAAPRFFEVEFLTEINRWWKVGWWPWPNPLVGRLADQRIHVSDLYNAPTRAPGQPPGSLKPRTPLR